MDDNLSSRPVKKRKLHGWLSRSRAIIHYGELWKPASDQYENLMLRESGREPDDLIGQHLLDNVIHAAGAIEYTVDKIEEALDGEQAWIDENGRDWSPPGGVRARVSGPHREEIQYEFTNLLFWLRAFQERLKRNEGAEGASRKLCAGLLPALAPNGPATKHALKLYRGLSQVIAERKLGTFATHAAAVPHPFPASEFIERKVRFKIPDCPTHRIHHWHEFTFADNRDLREYARRMLGSVERFIDGILDCFEGAQKEIESERGSASN